MPCNFGVSVATAQLSNEALAQLLTHEVAKVILEAVARERGERVTSYNYNAQNNTIACYIGDTSVTIAANRRVSARGGYGSTALADALKAAFDLGCDQLFAAEVAKALAELNLPMATQTATVQNQGRAQVVNLITMTI